MIPPRWLVMASGLAFVWASNYCTIQAFSSHHHDEHAQAPSHHDEAMACCAAMHAVTASRIDVRLAADEPWQPHAVQVVSLWSDILLALHPAASGLSPPAREPTPDRPFYRTTYANHAPPAYLA